MLTYPDLNPIAFHVGFLASLLVWLNVFGGFFRRLGGFIIAAAFFPNSNVILPRNNYLTLYFTRQLVRFSAAV
jgi:hypothetical protein